MYSITESYAVIKRYLCAAEAGIIQKYYKVVIVGPTFSSTVYVDSGFDNPAMVYPRVMKAIAGVVSDAGNVDGMVWVCKSITSTDTAKIRGNILTVVYDHAWAKDWKEADALYMAIEPDDSHPKE